VRSPAQLLPDERDLAARRSGVIAKVCKLPPFAPAALRLLAISTDSASAVDDFEAAFSLDPALAANLLVTANSPLFAFRCHISSIRRAIALLGLDAVRSLALTVGMRTYISRSGTQEAVQSVWRHSVAAAVIAETLARHGGLPDVPVLYTAGLLHDIGRLALLSTEGARYAGILGRQHYDLEESLLLETLAFGCTHDDVGAFLCRSWGFPELLCDCVRFHHQAVAAHAGPLFGLVGLACRLADALELAEVHCAHRGTAPFSDLLPDHLASCPDLQPERLRERILKMTSV
jgi:putative nucleotidyltransferase with HDIG domain